VDASLVASKVNNSYYAVPTWTCGNYIFCRQNMDPFKEGFDPLSIFLKFLSLPVALNSDLQGGWTLGSLYADAYIDTYGPESIGNVFKMPLDSTVLNYLKKLSTLCDNTSECEHHEETAPPNECLNKFHGDETLFVSEYAEGKVSASMSFGEFLSKYILAGLVMDAEHPQYIISAPLGTNSHPMLYIDAQVINVNCVGQCLIDSLEWIKFFHSQDISSLIALAQDIPDRKSFRYLAPSMREFYSLPAVASDPIYPQVFAIIEKAVAFPSSGFPEVHNQMYDVICQVLGNCKSE